MKFRWNINNNYDEKNISELTQNLKIPSALAKVLTVRGVKDIEAAKRFLYPKLADLHNPFLMQDMQKAVERILKGIKNKEKFWIHGDYDVDGTASTALITLFLRELGADVDYYIPDRFNEGYGISPRSIEMAIEQKVTVLITVDVGITSNEMLDLAAQNNIDTIICDHHEPGDILPNAYAILDPFANNCSYPFKPLAACGVVFKLIQAIATKLEKPEMANEYLDFVAIASAADMVPLLDENRVILHYGLQKINTSPHNGFKSLIYCAGVKAGAITVSNIVYAVAPLINAAGRVGKGQRSVEMMTQQCEFSAFRIAQELEDENRKRRVFDQNLYEEVSQIATEQIASGKHSLVIYGEDWHAGVIGVVASRLVDKYCLPVILLSKIEEKAKGSARSSHNFDMYSALKQCEDLLLEFGGHKHAAGVSLEIDKLVIFSEAFDKIAKETITKEMFVPELLIDAELKFNELSPIFFDILAKFAPFGFSNPKPLFVSHGVKSMNGVKIVGPNSIRFRAIQDNFAIDAIAPGLADKIRICQSGESFSIVYNLENYKHKGRQNHQLLIKDIQ